MRKESRSTELRRDRASPAGRGDRPSGAGGESSEDRSRPDWPRLRIGEVSRRLGVEASTLRYWEKVFPQLRPYRRRGQRLYRERDLDLLTGIRTLLYEEGYTIRGARDLLCRLERPTHGPEERNGSPSGQLEEAKRQLRAIVERLRQSGTQSSDGSTGSDAEDPTD